MNLYERYRITLSYQEEPDADGNFDVFEHETNGIKNSDLVVLVQEEEEQIFMRELIESPIVFGGEDFDFLDAMEHKRFARYMPLRITIERRATNEIAYTGQAYLDSADFTDKCNGRIAVSFTANDQYSQIYNSWNEKKNLLTIPTKVTLKAAYTGQAGITEVVKQVVEETVQITLFMQSAPETRPTWPSGSEGWVVIADNVEPFINTPGAISPTHYKRTTTFAREITKVSWTPATFPFPSEDWRQVNVPSLGTRYVRSIPSIIDTERSSTDSFAMGTSPQIWSFTSWKRVHFWGGESIFGWDNGIRLKVAIQALLPAGFTLSSHLLNQAGTGSVPARYLDSRLAAWAETVLYQKSDVVRPAATNNATVNEVSLKEMLDRLRDDFKIYWELQGTTFVLEHISYFEERYGADLQYSAFGCGYKYDKAIPSRIKYENAEHGAVEPWTMRDHVFRQPAFSYYSSFEAEQTRTSANYNVLYQAANYNVAETNGWTLAHGVEYAGVLYMRHGYGLGQLPTSQFVMTYNPYMTPAERRWLQGHQAPWYAAFARTVRRWRVTEDITIKDCRPWEIDYNRLINGNQGWSKVKQAKYSLTKGWLKLSLYLDEVTQQ